MLLDHKSWDCEIKVLAGHSFHIKHHQISNVIFMFIDFRTIPFTPISVQLTNQNCIFGLDNEWKTDEILWDDSLGNTSLCQIGVPASGPRDYDFINWEKREESKTIVISRTMKNK